jgi:hypothetical protein
LHDSVNNADNETDEDFNGWRPPRNSGIVPETLAQRIEGLESSGRCCADFEEEDEADVIGATCF